MSSDEDDYMSDKFLPASVDVGLPKRKHEQRQHELYKKKLKVDVPKKSVKEAEARDLALKTAISSENKGFKMLERMGYKPGTGLGKSNEGLLEPISITLKKDLSGVGGSKKAKHRVRPPVDTKAIEDNFKKSLLEKTKAKQTRKYFLKAQSACEHLDTDTGITQPMLEYFWYIKPKQEGNSESENEEPDPLIDDSNPDEPPKELTNDDFINEPNLSSIVEYLRSEHFYCIFCASKGESIEDLHSFCPGPTQDDHEDT